MNNWQVTLTLVEINSSYDEEGRITINGTGKFQFYDNKQWMECPIPFQARGNAALVIDNAGIGSTVMISGKLNLFKVENNLNPRMVLNVERAIAVTTAEDVVSEPSTIVEPTTTVEPQLELVGAGINVNNNGHQNSESLDDITF